MKQTQRLTVSGPQYVYQWWCLHDARDNSIVATWFAKSEHYRKGLVRKPSRGAMRQTSKQSASEAAASAAAGSGAADVVGVDAVDWVSLLLSHL